MTLRILTFASTAKKDQDFSFRHYLIQTEKEVTFCTCDRAAIKLISYMELEKKSISLEKVLKPVGYPGKNLYSRHLEKNFKAAVKEGKALRIQFKRLV